MGRGRSYKKLFKTAILAVLTAFCLQSALPVAYASDDLGTQSIFRPLTGREIRDMGFLKYLILTTLSSGDRPDLNVESSIYDEPVSLNFAAARNIEVASFLLPCRIGRHIYYSYVRRSEDAVEVTTYTSDEFEQAGTALGGVRGEQERIDRYALHEKIIDELLRKSHEEGDISILSPTDPSVGEVLSFLEASGMRGLKDDLTELVTSDGVFIVKDLPFSHASGRAIHLSGSAGDRASELAYQVSARAGFPARVNGAFREAFKAFRGSEGQVPLAEHDMELFDLLAGASFDVDLDETEQRDFGMPEEYEEPPVASDIARAPDHRLLNAVIRVAVVEGLSFAEKWVSVGGEVSARIFGPDPRTAEQGEEWVVKNALLWAAREEGLVAKTEMEGDWGAGPETLTLWVLGTADCRNLSDVYCMLSKKGQDSVFQVVRRHCRKHGITGEGRIKGFIYDTIAGFHDRNHGAFHSLRRNELYVIYGYSADMREHIRHQGEQLAIKKKIAALTAGYHSWRLVPEEKRKEVLEILPSDPFFGDFGDLYDLFDERMKQKVELYFVNQCIEDGVPQEQIQLLFDKGLARLKNVSGHAGVTASTVYAVNAGLTAKYLIGHEMKELELHQEWVARKNGYTGWKAIPEDKKADAVDRARYEISMEPGERMTRKARPEYTEFCMKAHENAERLFPVSGAEELIPDEGLRALQEVYHAPITGLSRSGAPAKTVYMGGGDKYAMKTDKGEVNIAGLLVLCIRELLGDDREFVLIPAGSMLYIRDEKGNVLWNHVKDLDFDILLPEDDEHGGSLQDLERLFKKKLEEYAPGSTLNPDLSFHYMHTENAFDEFAHYHLGLFPDIFGTREAMRKFARFMLADDLLENIADHYLWMLEPGRVELLIEDRGLSSVEAYLKRLRCLVYGAWMRGDKKETRKLIEHLEGYAAGKARPKRADRIERRMKKACEAAHGDKEKKFVDRVLGVNRAAVKKALAYFGVDAATEEEPSMASDIDNAPDHRFLNAVVNVGIEEGYSSLEQRPSIVKGGEPVSVHTFGVSEFPRLEAPDIWLIEALFAAAKDGRMARERRLGKDPDPKSVEIATCLVLDEKCGGSFKDFHSRLSAKGRERVRESFNRKCATHDIRHRFDQDRRFREALKKLEGVDMYMDPVNAQYYATATADLDHIRKSGMHAVKMLRAMAARQAGFRGWDDAPQEKKRGMVEAARFVFRNFGEMYEAFSQEAKEKVEKAFKAQCSLDGVSHSGMRLLLAGGIRKLANIAGHPGLKRSAVYMVGGAEDPVMLLKHEMLEMMLHQTRLAREAGYDNWWNVPDKKRKRLIADARYARKRNYGTAGKTETKAVKDPYRALVKELHTVANTKYPVAAPQKLQTADTVGLTAGRHFEPPIAASVPSNGPDSEGALISGTMRLLLGTDKDLTKSEIASSMALDKGRVSGILKRMEEYGLVTRRSGKRTAADRFRAKALEERKLRKVLAALEDTAKDADPGDIKKNVLGITDEEWTRILAREVTRQSEVSGKSGDNIIIAVETSWIPDWQRGAIENMLAVMRKRGNVLIVTGEGEEFSRKVRRMRDEAGVKWKNVLVLGSREQILDSGSFDDARAGKEGVFLAAVDPVNIAGNQNSYIRILEMLTIASRYAFHDKPMLRDHPMIQIDPRGERVLLLTPLPEMVPMDPGQLLDLYEAQRTAFESA